MKPLRSNDGLDELRRDPRIGNTETGGGWQHVPTIDPNDPELAALDAFGTQMRRGRFRDALPEEEQRQITLIISPDGGVQVGADTGADPMTDMDPMGEAGEDPAAPDEDESLDLP